MRRDFVPPLIYPEILGSSEALRRVLSDATKVAPTDSTVLITGETGTGKELVARAIHRHSHRAGNAFIPVNCAALAPDLIVAELFGHEKGAFTGAQQRRIGRFELARGGTIFLDEIGDLPADAQIALLRVLQERKFWRVGGGEPIEVDVRVIAATDRDLKAAIAAGTFRMELFYRLNVFPIAMPSLRQRKEDIPILARHFLDLYASKSGKKIRDIDKGTLELLQSYDWPGNVRELQNVIERAVILCEFDILRVDEAWLLGELAQHPSGHFTELLLAQEKELIESALALCKGQVAGASGAAARLGVPPSTLESKIKALKIDKDRF